MWGKGEAAPKRCRRAARAWAAGLTVIAGLALLAGPAAACTTAVTKRPLKTVNPNGKAPLAIGDSTMVDAAPYLARVGYRVNARICRMWPEGMDLLRQLKRQGRLPHLVMINLGANWKVTRGDIRQARHILGRKRVLALMTPLEDGGWSGRDASNMRWAFRRAPRRVVLLDWARYSRGRSGWFWGDQLHPTPKGAKMMARLAGKAAPWARAGQFPFRERFPRR